MSVDYEKLINLDYTAFERSQDFQRKLDELHITHPSVGIRRDYEGETPVVEAVAIDMIDGTSYTERYYLEDVTREEAEEIMFDIWEGTMEELEQY